MGGVSLDELPNRALRPVEVAAGHVDQRLLDLDAAAALVLPLGELSSLLQQPVRPLEVAPALAREGGEQKAGLGRATFAANPFLEEGRGLLAQGLLLVLVDARALHEEVGEPRGLDGIARGQPDRLSKELLRFLERVEALVSLGHAEQAVRVGEHGVFGHRGLEVVDTLVATTLAQQEGAESRTEPALVGEHLDALLHDRDGANAGSPREAEAGGLVEELGHWCLLDRLLEHLLDRLDGVLVLLGQLELEQPGVRVRGVLLQRLVQSLLDEVEARRLGPQHAGHRLEPGVVVRQLRLRAQAEPPTADGHAVLLVLHGLAGRALDLAGADLVELGELGGQVEVGDLAPRQVGPDERMHPVQPVVGGAVHVEHAERHELEPRVPLDLEIGEEVAVDGLSEVRHVGEHGPELLRQLLDALCELLLERPEVVDRLHLHEVGVVRDRLAVLADPGCDGEGARGHGVTVQPLRDRPEPLAGKLDRLVRLEELVEESALDADNLDATKLVAHSFAMEPGLTARHEHHRQRSWTREQLDQQHLEARLAEEVAVATHAVLEVVHTEHLALQAFVLQRGRRGVEHRHRGVLGLQQLEQRVVSRGLGHLGDPRHHGVEAGAPPEPDVGQALDLGALDGVLQQSVATDPGRTRQHDRSTLGEQRLHGLQLFFAAHERVDRSWDVGAPLLDLGDRTRHVGRLRGGRTGRKALDEGLASPFLVVDVQSRES